MAKYSINKISHMRAKPKKGIIERAKCYIMINKKNQLGIETPNYRFYNFVAKNPPYKRYRLRDKTARKKICAT